MPQKTCSASKKSPCSWSSRFSWSRACYKFRWTPFRRNPGSQKFWKIYRKKHVYFCLWVTLIIPKAQYISHLPSFGGKSLINIENFSLTLNSWQIEEPRILCTYSEPFKFIDEKQRKTSILWSKSIQSRWVFFLV